MMSSRSYVLLLVFSVVCWGCLGQGQGQGLRHKWTDRPLKSEVARRLDTLTRQCVPASSKYKLYSLNNYGMGSSIGSCLVKATCNSLQEGTALRTIASGPSKKWIWVDEDFCQNQPAPYNIEKTGNPLQCYFGNVFTPCVEESPTTAEMKPHVQWQQLKCPRLVNHVGNYTASTNIHSDVTEYMFSQVNPAVVDLVEKEALKIFGPNGAPEKMITVHIRWGDKAHEMGGSLVSMDQYVAAVKYFIKKHGLSTVSIFLTTEDPRAATLFKTHDTVLKNKWTIYEYTSAISPNKATHTPALDAKASKGKFGLISLIVLLLSMESQYFVLTTASNWSVLMQSLVISVVNQRSEVDYIDLRRNPLNHKAQYSFNTKNKLPKNYPYNDDGVLAFPIGSSII